MSVCAGVCVCVLVCLNSQGYICPRECVFCMCGERVGEIYAYTYIVSCIPLVHIKFRMQNYSAKDSKNSPSTLIFCLTSDT